MLDSQKVIYLGLLLLLTRQALGDRQERGEEEVQQDEEDRSTMVPFQHSGSIHLDAVEGLMVLQWDFGTIQESLLHLEQTLHNKSFPEEGPKQDIISMGMKLGSLRRRLEDAGTIFQAGDGDRQHRSLLAAVFGGLGLAGIYNMLTYQDLRRHQESLDKASQATMHLVEEEDLRIQANSDNIQTLAHYVQHEEEVKLINDVWWTLEGPIWDISQVSNTLPTHRLHPAAKRLADLPAAWRKFKRSLESTGRTTPSPDWQTIFQMPISFWGQGTRCAVAIHVPLIQSGAKPHELWKWSGLPILHGSTMVEMLPEERFVAERGLEIQGMTHSQVQAAYKMGRTRYYSGPRISRSRSNPSCLETLWSSDWKNQMKTCRMARRPPSQQAKYVGQGRFNLLLPEPVEVATICNGKVVARKMKSGQLTIAVKSGCILQTQQLKLDPKWQLRAIRIQLKPINVTRLVEGGSVVLKRPERIRTGSQLAELRETMQTQKPITYTSLGFSLSVGAGALAFAVFLYFKARVAWDRMRKNTRETPNTA